MLFVSDAGLNDYRKLIVKIVSHEVNSFMFKCPWIGFVHFMTVLETRSSYLDDSRGALQMSVQWVAKTMVPRG